MTPLTTLDGVPNFRDLGGLPAVGNQTVRRGVVYRSAAPGSITASGLQALAESSIVSIADLRADDERRTLPTRLPSRRSGHGGGRGAIEITELPIMAGSLSQENLSKAHTDPLMQDLQGMFAGGGIPSLTDIYLIMIQQGKKQFATVASLIGQAGARGESVLVHCTAGKDRTGIACALVLDTVGVPREAIIDNYTQSQTYLAGPWADAMLAKLEAAGIPLDPRVVALVTTSPADAIVAALNWVDENYGGGEEYLLAAGLPVADLDSMTRALLGDAC